MSGSVLQAYLEAIRAKVPELVEKEEIGEGVQGEVGLSNKIVQGDLKADEWKELSLDSVMVDVDAAVNIDTAKADAMATVKVVDSDDALQSASSFTFQLLSSNYVNGIKSHLVQNLIKKPKAPLLVSLPPPLLCPCTFLVSLTLPSKFKQGRCYSNKAWAKLSGLPPREISHYECPWVSKTLAGSPAVSPSSNRAVVTVQNGNANIVRFGTPLPCHLSSNSKGAGLRRSSTLLVSASGFSQDPLLPALTVPAVAWVTFPWTPKGATTFGLSNDSLSTLSLSHSPLSADSLSKSYKCQVSSMPPIHAIDKVSSDLPPVPYAHAVQPAAMLGIDLTSHLMHRMASMLSCTTIRLHLKESTPIGLFDSSCFSFSFFLSSIFSLV